MVASIMGLLSVIETGRTMELSACVVATSTVNNTRTHMKKFRRSRATID